jgi:hypothetical protein
MQAARQDQAGGRPDRVILYGPASERWRTALSPEGGIWDEVPGVSEVLLVERRSELLRQGWAGGRQSIVIPLRRRALQRFPPLYWNLAPGRRVHDICFDKIRFDRFMRRAGFAGMLPRSWRRAEECRFPCVIKRNNEEGGFGVRVVNSAAELAEVMGMRPFTGGPVIFQELIEGLVDHATHCVAVDGRIVWHTSYAYDIDPVVRVQTPESHAARRRFALEPGVLAAFERVLRALRFNGPASFDWRPVGDGIVLFEINPRFGGSMMMPINRDDLRAALTAVVTNARPPKWLPKAGVRGLWPLDFP